MTDWIDFDDAIERHHEVQAVVDNLTKAGITDPDDPEHLPAFCDAMEKIGWEVDTQFGEIVAVRKMTDEERGAK